MKWDDRNQRWIDDERINIDDTGFFVRRLESGNVCVTFSDIDPYHGDSVELTPDEWDRWDALARGREQS